jgi:hypothetical protein
MVIRSSNIEWEKLSYLVCKRVLVSLSQPLTSTRRTEIDKRKGEATIVFVLEDFGGGDGQCFLAQAFWIVSFALHSHWLSIAWRAQSRQGRPLQLPRAPKVYGSLASPNRYIYSGFHLNPHGPHLLARSRREIGLSITGSLRFPF